MIQKIILLMKNKYSIIKYVLFNKKDKTFLKDISHVGYGSCGNIIFYDFCSDIKSAMINSEKKLLQLISIYSLNRSINLIDRNDLEVNKLKITYEIIKK